MRASGQSVRKMFCQLHAILKAIYCSAQVCDENLQNCGDQNRQMRHGDFWDAVYVMINDLKYPGGDCKGTGTNFGLSIDVNRDTSAQCSCSSSNPIEVLYQNCPGRGVPYCEADQPCQCVG